MANTTELIAKLKIITDIQDVKTNAKTIQGVFDKLKLPESQAKGFANIFSTITQKVDSASDAMKRGFTDNKSLKTLEQDLSDIDTLYTQLLTGFSGIDPSYFAKALNFDDTPLKDYEQELANLKTQLKELGTESGIESLTGDIQQLKNISKSVSIENFFKSFSNGNIEETSIQLQNLINNIKSFGSQDFKKSDTFTQMSAEIDQIISALQGGQLDQAAAGMQNIATATKDLTGNDAKVKEYAQLIQKLITYFTSLSSKADKFTEVNSKIGELGQKILAIKSQPLEEIVAHLNEMATSAETASTELTPVKDKILEAANAQKSLNDEVNMITSQVSYYTSLYNGVMLFRQALQSAYEQVKALDEAMTETAVVTDFSVGDMWDKLSEYTDIANTYGSSIEDAYEVMTIFYQQGLNTNETFALGQETMQMAKIANLDYAESADRMTNALRGFNMELNEVSAQRVNDVYSELAAISASDTDELSKAMTKTASIANSANMSFENTAAFLAQIIETTRESA